jgi:hypothetical protein
VTVAGAAAYMIGSLSVALIVAIVTTFAAWTQRG